jgi:hypothetical protein
MNRRSGKPTEARNDATTWSLFFSRTVLWGGMVRLVNRNSIVAALIALLVAVFVLIPTVDAAACAVELEPTHAAASVADDGGDLPSDPDDHAICSHGHCHHSGTAMPASPQTDAMTTALAPSLLRPTDEPLASRAPSGLERPPRA